MSLRLPVPLEGKDRLTSPHKGLLLDKYVPLDSSEKGHAPALRLIASIPSSSPPYVLAFTRWKELTSGMANLTGTIRGRMALGLGIESVLEIGCRLHSTYGVPVIPGSSLKGALRAYLESDARYTAAAKFLFGELEGAGFADVYDGWWDPSGNNSGLAPDVITVHHQKYYAGKAAPVDFESPVPVPFLTVTGKFYFAIRTPNESWDRFVTGALKELLEKRGIGAKRSSGYGRFKFASASPK